MGKPTTKKSSLKLKVFAVLVVGMTLGVIVALLSSTIKAGVRNHQEAQARQAEAQARAAEAARVRQEEFRKEAVRKVPLARLSGETPAMRSASAATPKVEKVQLATLSQPVAAQPSVALPDTATIAPLPTARQPHATPGQAPRIALATISNKDASPKVPHPAPAKSKPAPQPELLQPVALIPTGKGEAGSLATPATQPIRAGNLAIATLEGIKKQMPPPLEEQREKEEKLLTAEQDTVKIVTGFECSTPLEIEKVSPTHFKVKITTDTTLKNWFMFRLEGVKGKTVRVDIKEAPLNKWWSLNPVYSYVPSIDDLDAFTAKPVEKPKEPVKAYNGPLLPDTSGQKWHYVSHVWKENEAYSLVQTYEQDNAYLAMRCPYSVKYSENYITSLTGRSDVRVLEVGKSKKGRPLYVVRVGASNPTKVPCVVMYAREHPDEHDTSWAVQAAIDWLTSDTPEAKKLRSEITLLAIPLLDPDRAAASKYEVITQNFIYDGQEGLEARAFAGFFRQWIAAGCRLDLVLNLHNVESAEGSHLFCPATEPEPERKALAETYHAAVVTEFNARGYSVTEKSLGARTTWFRLSGYLGLMYGPLAAPYELNSQERGRHLTLGELREMGPAFLRVSANFIASPPGDSLVTSIAGFRQRHRERMAKYARIFTERSIDNAIQIEWVSLDHEIEARQQSKVVEKCGP